MVLTDSSFLNGRAQWKSLRRSVNEPETILPTFKLRYALLSSSSTMGEGFARTFGNARGEGEAARELWSMATFLRRQESISPKSMENWIPRLPLNCLPVKERLFS